MSGDTQMGNKSKQKQGAKWSQTKQTPPQSLGWAGLQGPQEGKKLPVLWPSSERGTFRRIAPLNSQTGR